jgi:hypothetical protein
MVVMFVSFMFVCGWYGSPAFASCSTKCDLGNWGKFIGFALAIIAASFGGLYSITLFVTDFDDAQRVISHMDAQFKTTHRYIRIVSANIAILDRRLARGGGAGGRGAGGGAAEPLIDLGAEPDDGEDPTPPDAAYFKEHLGMLHEQTGVARSKIRKHLLQPKWNKARHMLTHAKLKKCLAYMDCKIIVRELREDAVGWLNEWVEEQAEVENPAAGAGAAAARVQGVNPGAEDLETA